MIARRLDVAIGSFRTEGGGEVPNASVRAVIYGELTPGCDATLVLHPLTGNAEPVSLPGDPSSAGGWWDGLVGEGRLLDPGREPVIAMNVLGSCYGSTGPAHIAPDGQPWGLRLPAFTIRDLVRAQARVLDAISVRAVTAIGGSLGGMLALEWARLFPERVRQSVVIGASDALGPRALMENAVQRQAIVTDPDFDPLRPGPTRGLALARQIAMITYRGDASLSRQFGRRRIHGAKSRSLHPTQAEFAVETYLEHQGRRLTERFCALSYLMLLRAMDSHDATEPVPDAVPPSRSAPVHYVGISSDTLFPALEVRQSAGRALSRGQSTTYSHFRSAYGHDAFLVETRQLAPLLRPLLGYAGDVSTQASECV